MPMLDITRLSSNPSIQSNQAPERGRPKPVWDTPCVLGFLKPLRHKRFKPIPINKKKEDFSTGYPRRAHANHLLSCAYGLHNRPELSKNFILKVCIFTQKWCYIKHYLDKVSRICDSCDFDQPDSDHMSKSADLKLRLRMGRNIAATHALFYLMDDEAVHLIHE